MRVIPGIAQHVGDRESQQDAYGFSSFGDRAFESHGGVMMVLCDGMGGLANGAIASRSAVGAVLSGYSRKQPSEDIPSALERVVREAHQAVCAICAEGGTAGTTIVVAVICRDRLYWTWLGDSRLYLCRRGAPAEQLTEDHNVASLQRAEGALRDAAAATNPEALTAYLGAPYLPQSPTVRDRRLLPGDRIVACSDGLYRGLPPEAIASAAHRGQPMNAAEQMINAVLKQRLPHQDNVTVVLFELSSIHPLAIFVRAPSPTGAAVLSGSICLATGIVLGGVLNSFGC